MVSSCSTKKNTGRSRFWQSFTAKYNTYYNGTLAYIDGSLEKEQQNVDNFTEMIPLYYVGNKNSVSIGQGNFDRAIEKCQKAIKLHSIKRKPVWNKKRRKTDRDLEWLNRREYNPMLWKAWLLMGRSQFHSGDFDGAASTFSYMSRLYQTQPAIYGKARAWLAKAYTEAGWLYDAEDVIRNIRRDSITPAAQKEWDYTLADYYIHTKDYAQAITYLREVIRHEGRKKQKAREYFLLGQLYAITGNNAEAYKSYKRVLHQHPPYVLQFNARIAMTEVSAAGQAKRMISKLKGMARSDNNKDYLDQVYYAMGNIYLTERDTLAAISAYEKGNTKSTRNGVEKGVLLLHLGNLYWDQEKFSDACRCYGEAIGLLDKDRPDYKELSERSQKLDLLVPFTESVHLQDSLLALSVMDEKERNEAIDRVITALKKREKEEADAAAEAAAQETIAKNGTQVNRTTPQATTTTATSGTWYFYSPQSVNQGKQAFQRQWGKRDNVDHWRRTNVTVVDFGTDEESAPEIDYTPEQLDSIRLAEEAAAAEEAKMDSAVNDPHKREYYLAQIPFTDEQKEEAHLTIQDGLYNAGVIFKDKLDMLQLSERQFMRLLTDYPTYAGMDNVYYHLFLLYSRLGQHDIAQTYITRLQEQFPESAWTTLLTDPYYADNQRFGVHIEDSLYAATYDAFNADRFSEIRTNVKLSTDRFPMGANRDKFVFIGGLGKLNDGDVDGCLAAMTTVVTDFPQSGLAEMAGMILNGVKQGRQLRGGKFDLDDVWARRQLLLTDDDSTAVREFTADIDVDHYVVLAYEPDSLSGNQLLYQLAKFNFTNYLVRNFDIMIDSQPGLTSFRISGFHNVYEAREYAQELYRQDAIADLLRHCRTIIISQDNIDLLGTRYSYDDYDTFYHDNIAPLDTAEGNLLFEPANAKTELDDGGSIPGNISPILLPKDEPVDDDGILIEDDDFGGNDNGVIIMEDYDDEPAEGQDNTVVIEDIDDELPAEEKGNTVVIEDIDDESPQAEEDNTVVVEDIEEVETEAIDDNTVVIEDELPVVEDDNTVVVEDIEDDLQEAIDDNTVVIEDLVGDEADDYDLDDDNGFNIDNDDTAEDYNLDDDEEGIDYDLDDDDEGIDYDLDNDDEGIDYDLDNDDEGIDYDLDDDDYDAADGDYYLDDEDYDDDDDDLYFDVDALGTEDEYFELDGF